MDVDIVAPLDDNVVVDDPLTNAEAREMAHQSTPLRADAVETHLNQPKKRVSGRFLAWKESNFMNRATSRRMKVIPS